VPRSCRKTQKPSNWVDFLHECENKKQLLHFFLAHWQQRSKHLATTTDPLVASTSISRNMEACNHEEVDARRLVHLQDSETTCLVCTVDTDLVIILVGKFHGLLERHPAANVWVAFGTGNDF